MSMERRLAANEALECVLDDQNYTYSSGEESKIEEDSQFPLPVAFSDDESFTPPTPVVNSYAPSLQTASTAAALAGYGITSMAAPTLPEAAPPTPPSWN